MNACRQLAADGSTRYAVPSAGARTARVLYATPDGTWIMPLWRDVVDLCVEYDHAYATSSRGQVRGKVVTGLERCSMAQMYEVVRASRHYPANQFAGADAEVARALWVLWVRRVRSFVRLFANIRDEVKLDLLAIVDELDRQEVWQRQEPIFDETGWARKLFSHVGRETL